MRHHDKNSASMIKFAFSFYSALGTVALAIHQILNNKSTFTDVIIGIISLFTSFVGVIIVLMLARNRVYFVCVARQLNSIRRTFLSKENFNLKFSNMLPVDPNIPKSLNPKSTHLATIFLLCILNTIAIYVGFGFLLSCFGCFITIFISFMLLCLQILLVVIVLKGYN